MSDGTQLWVRLELGMEQGHVTVSAEAPGQTPMREVRTDIDAKWLDEFTAAVGKAAEAAEPTLLGAETQVKAQQLFNAIFAGDVQSFCTQMVGEASHRPGAGTGAEQVLLQMSADDAWKGVPWEAMHVPIGSTWRGSFLATSPDFDAVREVVGGPAPEGPVECDKLRVLLIELADVGIADAVKEGLEDAIKKGLVELTEIRFRDADEHKLYAAIRSAPPPHIVHIIGHGSTRKDTAGMKKPVLQLGSTGDDTDISVQTLAEELASFRKSLRLVVLDACRGAEPGPYGRFGPTGNAAEILARNCAVAVVAHLFRLDPSIAREAAETFYESLVSKDGDVAESVDAARRVLAEKSAAAFSMVLYLRGQQTRLFVKPEPPQTQPPPLEPPPPDPPKWKTWVLPSVFAVVAVVAVIAVINHLRIDPNGKGVVVASRGLQTAWTSALLTVPIADKRPKEERPKEEPFDVVVHLDHHKDPRYAGKLERCPIQGEQLKIEISKSDGVEKQSKQETATINARENDCIATFTFAEKYRGGAATLSFVSTAIKYMIKKQPDTPIMGGRVDASFCHPGRRCTRLVQGVPVSEECGCAN